MGGICTNSAAAPVVTTEKKATSVPGATPVGSAPGAGGGGGGAEVTAAAGTHSVTGGVSSGGVILGEGSQTGKPGEVGPPGGGGGVVVTVDGKEVAPAPAAGGSGDTLAVKGAVHSVRAGGLRVEGSPRRDIAASPRTKPEPHKMDYSAPGAPPRVPSGVGPGGGSSIPVSPGGSGSGGDAKEGKPKRHAGFAAGSKDGEGTGAGAVDGTGSEKHGSSLGRVPSHIRKRSGGGSGGVPVGVAAGTASASASGTASVTGGSPDDDRKMRRKSSERKKKPPKRKVSHSGMINQIALQFPNIRLSFNKVQTVFNKFHDDHDHDRHAIDASKLTAVLNHIGEKKSFAEEEVKQLFHLADLDGSKTISFREFLIAIAIGYFLKVDSNAPEFQSIARGFKVVEKAFKDMDDDGSGTVDAKELKKALFAGHDASSGSAVLEARFRELDFNGDGDVTFPEFLYGFSQWVGFGEDLGEDDEKKGEDAKSEGGGPPSASPSASPSPAATPATLVTTAQFMVGPAGERTAYPSHLCPATMGGRHSYKESGECQKCGAKRPTGAGAAE